MVRHRFGTTAPVSIEHTHAATFPAPAAVSAHHLGDCNPGHIVHEPFCGTGSTIIAASRTARICYACEQSPAYVAVTLERYRDTIGDTPTLSP